MDMIAEMTSLANAEVGLKLKLILFTCVILKNQFSNFQKLVLGISVCSRISISTLVGDIFPSGLF